jgi:hypothetical protein
MDPAIAWACGAQLVALNFQSSDTPMYLNHCKFLENGETGYVLKGPHLTRECQRSMVPVMLTVTV